jgi:hypothetical protein
MPSSRISPLPRYERTLPSMAVYHRSSRRYHGLRSSRRMWKSSCSIPAPAGRRPPLPSAPAVCSMYCMYVCTYIHTYGVHTYSTYTLAEALMRGPLSVDELPAELSTSLISVLRGARKRRKERRCTAETRSRAYQRGSRPGPRRRFNLEMELPPRCHSPFP